MLLTAIPPSLTPVMLEGACGICPIPITSARLPAEKDKTSRSMTGFKSGGHGIIPYSAIDLGAPMCLAAPLALVII